MEIKKVNVGENEYAFINETWSRSGAWGHRSVLMINGTPMKEHKVRYYNRTWECYDYQTCMRQTVMELINEKQDSYIYDYKLSNSISRFKKGEKDKVIELFNDEKSTKELMEVYSSL